MPVGIDFPVQDGEGYLVEAVSTNIVSALGNSACPGIELDAGVNLVGIPSPPSGFGCFELLNSLGAASVTAVAVVR